MHCTKMAIHLYSYSNAACNFFFEIRCYSFSMEFISYYNSMHCLPDCCVSFQIVLFFAILQLIYYRVCMFNVYVKFNISGSTTS